MKNNKITAFTRSLESARTIDDLDRVRRGIRTYTHATCGDGAGENARCRKTLRARVNSELVRRAGQITSDQATTIQNNIQAFRKATTPRQAAAGDTPSSAWIAILAGVALLIFLH